MPKQSIRSRMLAMRKHLAAETCLSLSLQIQGRLLESREFQTAATVALYSPVLNEVFTEQVFHEALAGGKLVAYPRVRGNELEFVQVLDPSDLRQGTFGVLEPVGMRIVSPESIDLAVVPGVAFDRAGHRLGYGKGFYDRGLHGSRCPGFLAGLCFEQQLVDRLPAEEHDVRMDILFTEKGRYDFAKPHSPVR
jgi:5-formyltetrahydrofolate cyclo-ligase